MATFSSILRRIAIMRWDERRTRAAQEMHKRLDLALYLCGLSSNSENFRAQKNAQRGNFFFSASELPQRIALLKEKLSGQTEAIVQQAEEICRHHFDLLGYENVDYGPKIDWRLDAVHGKRAPMKPWFKIDFLNFDEVGDHKVVWELNRHQHLVTLAKAWRLTGDEKYLIELQAQWHSWRRENPYPIGINWGSSLEVAFRSLSWIWMLSLLSESDRVRPDFRTAVIRALALNGRYIERNLSTYFSPNTHLLGEALGLFVIGLVFPEITAADRWRGKGMQILIAEAPRQVRSDGVYFEQSLYYHVYALDFFLHARILAGRNGITFPQEFDARLNKMLDVVCSLSQLGIAEGFGDDDGGRVFDPRRNRCEHLTDPLALGAVLFRREDLNARRQLTEESVWLFGEEAVSSLPERKRSPEKVKTDSFANGGLYVMRTSGKVPMQMMMDAGPQGTGRSGHGHADALSVTLEIGGHRWLVDSGALSYVGPERDRFRGTGAHNTVRVDGTDQAIPDGRFAWKSIPEVRCENWTAGRSFSFFAGSHNGYKRLPDPVTHRRYVFYLHDEFWMVRDLAQGQGNHHVEINWHFASDVRLVLTGKGFFTSSIDPRSGDCGLAILPVEDSEWNHSLIDNFISPAYGKKDAAPALRSSIHANLPVEHGTLLAPCDSAQGVGRFSKVNAESEGLAVYSYIRNECSHYMIFADPQLKTWTWKMWTSDANFLYFNSENGLLNRLLFCDGRELSLNGITVVKQPHIAPSFVPSFEWSREAGLDDANAEAVMVPVEEWQQLQLTPSPDINGLTLSEGSRLEEISPARRVLRKRRQLEESDPE